MSIEDFKMFKGSLIWRVLTQKTSTQKIFLLLGVILVLNVRFWVVENITPTHKGVAREFSEFWQDFHNQIPDSVLLGNRMLLTVEGVLAYKFKVHENSALIRCNVYKIIHLSLYGQK